MILVIDDDAFVREAVTDILEYEGIPLLTAVSGEIGIALYREQMQNIDLVLLDMSMPGLDGAETFYELQKINANVPVLLSSGYTDQEINGRFPPNSILGFLQKPYDLTELISAIRNYLPSKKTTPNERKSSLVD